MSYTIDGFYKKSIENFSNTDLNKSLLYGKWKNDKMYVGPDKGRGDWWSSCGKPRDGWDDDTFEFTQDNKLKIKHNGTTWLEGWQTADGKEGEGEPIAAGQEGEGEPMTPFIDGEWDFTFNKNENVGQINETGEITLNGAGAYISLPKAYNDWRNN